MESLAPEAVAGFNTLIAEQRSLCPHTRFSLALFDHENLFIHDAVPLAQIPDLTSATFVPRGSTALNDAIAAMIQRIGQRAKRSSRVLIAILTDGCENMSREFSIQDLLQMVTYRRTTYDWQFVFIGPQDALSYALSIGIPKSNVVAFDTDPAGIKLIMSRRLYALVQRQLAPPTPRARRDLKDEPDVVT
jgi:hypothetical protein